jgi:RHS repeat-associated protein
MIQDSGTTFLPAYDGNGNLHALMTVSAATIDGTAYAAGDIVAAYEYDAFGCPLRESGAYAASNPFRFSTKYTDTETGLVNYGHRYYSPSLGRFINQDPIGEQGGLNLYAFTGNDPVNSYDYLGGLKMNPWVSNILSAGSGLVQVAVGVSVGTAISWTGVGAVGGGILAVNGAAQFWAAAGNIGSLLNNHSGNILNTSGSVGLVTSAAAFANDAPYTASDARLASALDFTTGLVAGGIPFATKVPNSERSAAP